MGNMVPEPSRALAETCDALDGLIRSCRRRGVYGPKLEAAERSLASGRAALAKAAREPGQ